MSRGYVYVLSNPSMPGLVKIGRTTRSVEQRANELWQTGVPTPFFIEYSQLFPNCIDAEAILHSEFEDYRRNDCREFFEVSPDTVISSIECMIRARMAMLVEEYQPHLSLVDAEADLTLSILQERAIKIGVKLPILAMAGLRKTDYELWADVQRAQEFLASERLKKGGAA